MRPEVARLKSFDSRRQRRRVRFALFLETMICFGLLVSLLLDKWYFLLTCFHPSFAEMSNHRHQ